MGEPQAPKQVAGDDLIADIPGRHRDHDGQAQRVDHEMSFAPVDFLARVVAAAVPPTVEAAFTDWESTISVTGNGQRPLPVRM
ncbi:hypothetical protein [Streptomyces sp. NPDC020607]|uniref:hypothetical protein n=1 Tax=Streptomyces sp. NPDC020607 TaxID=3365082 RepID=UPI003792DD6B